MPVSATVVVDRAHDVGSPPKPHLGDPRDQPISPVVLEHQRYHQPPSFLVVKELAQHLQNQMFIEKQVEKMKCQLAWQEDFNLFQTFKIFD